MKHIDVSYADLANIASLILKEGTVVSDEKRYIIGFSKDLEMPITLKLSYKQPSCILINVDFDVVTDRIISFYLKSGIYCNVGRSPYMDKGTISINLYSLES